MRLSQACVTLALLVLALLPAVAGPLSLQATLGFDGYYRAGTQIPVAVTVTNNGRTVSGNFSIEAVDAMMQIDNYRVTATIPKRSSRTMTLYCTPREGIPELEVAFHQGNRVLAATRITRAQQLFDTDRLVVVVGGSGSSLRYVNGQSIQVPNSTRPRAWDFPRLYQYHMGWAGNNNNPTNGQVRLVNIAPEQLPDTAEAYGSVSMLVLMSDVTENTLTAGMQEAITSWVVSGGHLLVAGGGVTARFNAPFYTTLLPVQHGKATRPVETITAPGLGTIQSAVMGDGRVSQMSVDPEGSGNALWQQASQAFGQLAAREPNVPASGLLLDTMAQAVAVRKLRPPSLALIIGYLAAYLLVLLPVNYFLLKKIDKRELAWLTTPVIVLIFSFGAYGIGYLTKGHQLIAHSVSILEIIPGQRTGTAISQLLLFSPARTTYQVALGEGAMVAQEVADNQMSGYSGQSVKPRLPLTYVTTGDALSMERILVNMWDFRRFSMAHNIDLNRGFASSIIVKSVAASRVSGVITNGTPLTLRDCGLYVDGVLVERFPLAAGDTYTCGASSSARPTGKVFHNEQAQHMYLTMSNYQSGIVKLFSAGQPLAHGVYLVGYTDNMRLPVRLNHHRLDAQFGVVIVHLK